MFKAEFLLTTMARMELGLSTRTNARSQGSLPTIWTA